MERARQDTDYVVVSVFVNPIQFDRSDDFERYPRTLDTDIDFCRERGVDVVFAPTSAEMYPNRQLTFVEVTELGERLCGEFRPGHFRGVATVVTKLLNIVQCERAYFGQKDAQQLSIIARMVADLNMDCEVISVPTVRESDGLAMSSRNTRLSQDDRVIAPLIYRSLQAAAAAWQRDHDAESAKQAAVSMLGHHPELRVEYLEIVHPITLSPIHRATGSALAITAVWLGQTRLIDNVLCTG
jgi:pantoate--beta-alanine ligase